MALLPILRWPDERLSKRCEEVDPSILGTLIADMFETMYAAPGRGLAAPQVGVIHRLFVMDATWKEGPGSPVAMINPEILAYDGETDIVAEGCLSIPGITIDVERPKSVSLRWQDQVGDWQERWFSGFEARCIQHEFDHLEGRVTFDHLEAEARQKAEASYASALENER